MKIFIWSRCRKPLIFSSSSSSTRRPYTKTPRSSSTRDAWVFRWGAGGGGWVFFCEFFDTYRPIRRLAFMPLIYSTYWSICKKIAKKCQLSSCCFTFIQKLRLRRPLYKPPASSTPPRPHSTTRPPPYAADRFDLGGECIELNQSQCVKIEHYKSSKKSP